MIKLVTLKRVTLYNVIGAILLFSVQNSFALQEKMIGVIENIDTQAKTVQISSVIYQLPRQADLQLIGRSNASIHALFKRMVVEIIVDSEKGDSKIITLKQLNIPVSQVPDLDFHPL